MVRLMQSVCLMHGSSPPPPNLTPHLEKGGKCALVALNNGWVCQLKKLRVSWQLHYNLCQYTPFPKPVNIWLIQLLSFAHRVFILQCSSHLKI